MRYHVLACDYDGTLAHHGRVDEPTIAALERLRATGRRLVLVTGREMDELRQVFPQLHLFERVVAENGALLYRPASREERLLGEPPPEAFVEALRQRGVEPMAVGRGIVATWEPHQTVVFETIHKLRLEWYVIFNKGAVMALPSGINKATGFAAALDELRLSRHNAVGVGDAENDHAFLRLCECAVAVENALDTIKQEVDLVTRRDHGAGVVELIDRLIDNDLRDLEPHLWRHEILMGTRDTGQPVRLKPYGRTVLLAGTSGSGKSTLATGLLERLNDQNYQFCIIDPEGDYSTLTEAVVMGDEHGAPSLQEVLELLDSPNRNAVVNLVGLALDHRPEFFERLMPRLQEMRARTGRPHWIVVDETHHLLPASWDPATLTLPQDLGGMLFITVHPEHVAPSVLAQVDLIAAVGESPEQTIRAFCRAQGLTPPELFPAARLEPGEALAWSRRSGEPPFRFLSEPPRGERRRHRRKYAQGELEPDRCFYFRGPQNRLKLRAQNLMIFLQMAEGVDEETWMHHLRQGDYSHWFRHDIKDHDLANETARIEQQPDITPEASLQQIATLVRERYTAPA